MLNALESHTGASITTVTVSDSDRFQNKIFRLFAYDKNMNKLLIFVVLMSLVLMMYVTYTMADCQRSGTEVFSNLTEYKYNRTWQ